MRYGADLHAAASGQLVLCHERSSDILHPRGQDCPRCVLQQALDRLMGYKHLAESTRFDT
jgi:hypothetical protein